MDFQGDQYKKKRKIPGRHGKFDWKPGGQLQRNRYPQQGGEGYNFLSPILTQKLPGKTIWELVTNLLLQLPQFQIVTEFVTGIWLRNLFSEKVFYMKLNSKKSLTER